MVYHPKLEPVNAIVFACVVATAGAVVAVLLMVVCILLRRLKTTYGANTASVDACVHHVQASASLVSSSKSIPHIDESGARQSFSILTANDELYLTVHGDQAETDNNIQGDERLPIYPHTAASSAMHHSHPSVQMCDLRSQQQRTPAGQHGHAPLPAVQQSEQHRLARSTAAVSNPSGWNVVTPATGTQNKAEHGVATGLHKQQSQVADVFPGQQSKLAFVATDIEGSTELWEKAPVVMEKALEVHDRLLRVLLCEHEGKEIATEGDAFTCAFTSAQDAVLWCLHVQQALMTASWPEELTRYTAAEDKAVQDGPSGIEVTVLRGLRVRMGVHTGANYTAAFHPVTGQSTYRGRSVDLADTISNMGYGGQVLVCGTTYREIYSRLALMSKLQKTEPASMMELDTPPASPIFDMHYPICINMQSGSMQSEASSASDSYNMLSAPGNTAQGFPGRHASTTQLTMHHTSSVFLQNMEDRYPAHQVHSYSALQRASPGADARLPSEQDHTAVSFAGPAPGTHLQFPYSPPSIQTGPSSTLQMARSGTQDLSQGVPRKRLWRRLSYFVSGPMRRTRPSKEIVAQLSEADVPPSWMKPGMSMTDWSSWEQQRATQAWAQSVASEAPWSPAAASTPAAAPRHTFQQVWADSVQEESHLSVEVPSPSPSGSDAAIVSRIHTGQGHLHRVLTEPGPVSVMPNDHSNEVPACAVKRRSRSQQDLLELQSDALVNTSMGEPVSPNSQLSFAPNVAADNGRMGLEYAEGSPGSSYLRAASRSMKQGAPRATLDLGLGNLASTTHGVVPMPLLIDMGRHFVGAAVAEVAPDGTEREDGTLHVVLVIPQQLRGRLQVWAPQLQSRRCTYAGYLQAPGTARCLRYIGCTIPHGLRPFVTMAFTSLDPITAKALQGGGDYSHSVLEAFCAVVRATLMLHHGYECQERNGIFMVAFPSMRPALEWGVLLQMALMKVDWGVDCQHLPNTEEVCATDGQVLFRGLRARVGVMHGEVLKICPHATAGRADYFGPVLNRTARLQGAAYGGQVLAGGFAVMKVVQEWKQLAAEANSNLPAFLASLQDGRQQTSVGRNRRASASGALWTCTSARMRHEAGAPSYVPVLEGEEELLSRRRASDPVAQDLLDPGVLHPSAPSQTSSSSQKRMMRIPVTILDQGYYAFKGVDHTIPVASITPQYLAEREQLYPQHPASSKVKLVKHGLDSPQVVMVELPHLSRLELSAWSNKLVLSCGSASLSIASNAAAPLSSSPLGPDFLMEQPPTCKRQQL